MSDLPTELDDRKAHRDAIAALLKASPLQDIEPDTLKAITPHYQQRISECRRKLGMTIENVRRTRQDADGRVRRQDGAYMYRPTGPALGRDAGTLAPAEWPTVHGRPFQEEYELT